MVYLTNYLKGKNSPDVAVLTRMDADQNKLIDRQDYNKMVAFYIGNETPQTITTSTLISANNETRTYCKHVYSDQTPLTTYQTYHLAAPTNSSIVSYSLSNFENDVQDCVNKNVVKLSCIDSNGNKVDYGTGFIVGDNIVATAGHCVYGKNENTFVKGIEVKVYDENCTQVLDTFKALSLHVPYQFVTATNGCHDNYDYGLIVVDNAEDNSETQIGDYGKWSPGIMTDEFISTPSNVVTTSGFTTYNGIDSRYYSSGTIIDHDEEANNLKPLRFSATAISKGGKSGGPVYYESTLGNKLIRSVVGICTGAGFSSETWGTRMTPTVARFFFNNPNL